MQSTLDSHEIQFRVVSKPGRVPSSGKLLAILLEDNWDDWGKFRTLFQLFVFDQQGERHDLGGVKIGQFDLKPAPASPNLRKGQRHPDMPNEFVQLDDSFFSLGQDDSYYETLGKLDPQLRQGVVIGLHDVVHDEGLWQKSLNEEVTGESLLRSVNRTSVEGQFRRLLQGGARLSPYSFEYTYPKRSGGGNPPIGLSFQVRPESLPPTNIHVIIGRNGVGKTYTLNLMTKALVGEPSAAQQSGEFVAQVGDKSSVPFANLVSVSFSAFDEFSVMPERKDKSEGIQYYYIGLKRVSVSEQSKQLPKSPEILATEFVKSVRLCLMGARASRWRHALEILEADPLFKEAEVSLLAEHSGAGPKLEEEARRTFDGLSSGHKIVLLSISRLVETVDERTLVLLDEPEAHLHPPLLAAFIRSLSDLLINRNGVAIVATHSPVVLQEVPKECVWILRRTGGESAADRPELETFGENVGILTREVFGLEVTQSGFHKMLIDASDTNNSFEQALFDFDDKLGAEARAILRGLFITKKPPAE